jgi:hypothetical protein
VPMDHRSSGLTGANGSSGSSGSSGFMIIRIEEVRDHGLRRRYNAGTRYNFSNSTVDADPGTGIF